MMVGASGVGGGGRRGNGGTVTVHGRQGGPLHY